MTRPTPASVAVALAVILAACSPSAPRPTADPMANASAASSSPAPVASANPCAVPVAHLTAFANRLGGQVAELRPLVTDPTFDSSATAAGIRAINGTFQAYDGLEVRLAACPPTVAIAEPVAALRADARGSIDASTHASIRDQVVQRAVAAALFGLLPAIEEIAARTRQAALSAGIDTEVALLPDASTEPLGSLPPLTTTTPPPRASTASVAQIDAAFFGPNATVTTYRISGRTPLELVASIRARGPRNDWLPVRAEAQTLATPHVGLELVGTGASCQVVSRAKPAVTFSFTITLPRWEPPSGVAVATVTWWNAELGRAATHENHHVDLWRATGTRMTRSAESSTCGNLQQHLAAIVKDAVRENCEFDMDEYGEALGLKLEDCVSR